LRRPVEREQYASLAFGRTLRESGLAASMGSRGDPYDNAMCESVVSTIKEELLKRRSWKTRDDARLAVFSYIETFYNPRRRHSALDYLSPDEYEKMQKKEDSLQAAAR
jgi:putative transposase